MEELPAGDVFDEFFVRGRAVIVASDGRCRIKETECDLLTRRFGPILTLFGAELEPAIFNAIFIPASAFWDHCPCQNHSHNGSEQRTDHEGVDDSKPVNASAFVLVVEIHVPSLRPLHSLVFPEIYGVCIGYRQRLSIIRHVVLGWCIGRLRVSIFHHRAVGRQVQLHSIVLAMHVLRTAFPITFPGLHTFCKNFESHNDPSTAVTCAPRCPAPSYHQRKMIIDEIPRLIRNRRYIFITQLEPCRVVFMRLVHAHKTRCARQIVHDPLHHVAIFYQVSRSSDALSIGLVLAEICTLLVLPHCKVVI